MIAKDIISINNSHNLSMPAKSVNAYLPVIDVLPRLLDSPGHVLTVEDEGNFLGIIDETSLLEGLGRTIASRDDSSIITLECNPEDYSASVISHAIEDTDAHLTDILTFPAENGLIRVTLRVRNNNPEAAVRSLERYGYNVIEAYGADTGMQTMEIATERLLSLQALMNV